MITCEWLDENQSSVRVRINGNMTIANAGELYQAVTDIFSGASQIHYDLQGVEELDVSGLQLLCSSHRSSVAAGKDFHISGMNRKPILTALNSAGYSQTAACHPEENQHCILHEGAK